MLGQLHHDPSGAQYSIVRGGVAALAPPGGGRYTAGVGAALLLLALCAAPAAASAPARDPRALASYDFDASRPLGDRVRRIPRWLLALWAKADGEPRYAAYAPMPDERREFAAALDGLPEPMKKVLRERLIAFYFVSDLKGNGLTDWVLDSSRRTYSYMLLNPAGFHEDLSKLLTRRARSAFRGRPDLRVYAGEEDGIVYTVSHECTHAVDYAVHLTPYTEPQQGKALGLSAPDGWDVWKAYALPRRRDDYPLRRSLSFYGFGGPNLDASQAPAACAQLAKSPFASLYGSRSWAEDLAELFVARHLTQDLHLPYRVLCGGKLYEPMKNPRVAARARDLLGPLYGKGAPRPNLLH